MPSSPHAFEQRTNALKGELVVQGRRVQALVEAAFEALFEDDREKASRVLRGDDAIDAADVAIEQTSVALLTDATSQGAQLSAQQLRLVLTIVKVNNELERVADVAVDVAELVNGAGVPGASRYPDTFRVMANSVIGILRDADTSLANSDPALAKVVLASQHTVTAFKNAILRDAEEQIAKGRMSVDFAFRLHEIASLCEVVADHCTNIAEQVIYLTTGAIVRHTETSWVEVPRK